MAENIGDAYVRVHARGDDIDDDIERMFGKLDLHDSGRDAGHDFADGMEEGVDERAPEESMLGRFKAMGERLTRLALEEKEIRFDDEVDMLKEHLSEEEHLKEESEKKDEDRSRRTNTRRDRDFRREHSRLAQLVKKLDGMGDGIGDAFGKKSRNDFIHGIGVVVGGVTRLALALPKVLSLVSDAVIHVGKAFADGIKSGEGFFSSIGKGAAGAVAALGDIALAATVGLAGVAIAAVALVSVLGPLVAVASGLIGAVTAVAASLSFALIGGLGLLAGAIAPIGFAVAGLALAFVGLDKATKNTVANALKPVIGSLKDLGAEVRKPILGAIVGQSAELGRVFSSLAPLFHGVGQSIAQTIRLIVRELSGSGGQSFFAAMTEAMPHAIVDLGEIFVHTIGGFGGIMRGLIPSFQRLLDFLEGVTFRFSNFTNSAKGQNAIKSFMDRAVDSAKSLGRLLLEVGGLFGDLFSAGRSTGDTIIDDLTNKVREFRNFIRSNPNGLQEWFSNGLDTIRNVGNVIRQIAEAFAALDTPQNRFVAGAMFQGMSIAVEILAGALRLAAIPLSFLVDQIALMAKVSGELLQVLGHVPGFGWAGDLGDKLVEVADSAKASSDALKNMPDPEVDAGPARDGIRGLGSDVDGLRSPSLTADMNIDPALSDADRLALGLDGLSSPVITPEVDPGPAHTALDGLHADTEGFTSPVIEPEADTAKAGHDLGRLRNDIGEATSKNFVFKAIANVANAKKDLGELRNAVPGGRGDNRPLKINIEAHAENARKQIGDLRKDMDGARSPVDLKVRTGSALGAITGLRKGIEKVKPKDVNLGARTGAALQAVTGLRKGIEKVKDKTTKIDTRTAQAKKNADTLTDAIGRVKDKRTKIDTQTAQAKKNADTLRDAIGRVKDKNTHIDTRTAQAKANVDRLASSINALHNRTITIETIRQETIRIRREQVPVPGSGGNAGLVADSTVNQATGRTGPTRGVAGGTSLSTGKTVNVNQLTLVSNSPDPRTVANEFLNSLVAASI